MHRNIPVFVCVLACALVAPALKAATCPVERGQVKNLADHQAADAFASPIREFTVADLASMPSRPKKTLLQYDTKRFPEELFHLHVQAILVGFKLEQDGDYHLILADLEDPRKTMIAEIPSPECITMDLQRDMWALRKAFDDAFGKPTSKYKKARPGTTVSVEGILFRDFAHRQIGAAPSQTEIHPVLSLERRTVKLPADSAWAD